jgi:hypothetical protein
MRYFLCDPMADIPMFDTPSWKILLELPAETTPNPEQSIRAAALEAIHSKCGDEFFTGFKDEMTHHSRAFPVQETKKPDALGREDGIVNSWRFWFVE